MKKIYITLALLATMFVTQSCTQEEDMLFSQSAAERLDASATETKTILESATNGWKMEYYLGAEYKYGGYNFLLKFKDGKVKVAGEIANNTDVSTSSYDVVKDMGPVLTINTYNEIFHYLAEPQQEEVDGYEGDYEFAIQRVTSDSIFLKGRKWGNKMLLTRMPESVKWEVFLDSINNVKDNLSAKYLHKGVEGASLEVDVEENKCTYVTKEASVKSPFIVTTTGIRLLSPLAINGVNVSNLSLDKNTFELAYPEAGDNKFVPQLPEDYQEYDEIIEGEYKLTHMFGFSSIPVQIKKDKNKTGFLISGLVSNADIKVTYSKKSGQMQIERQTLGKENGNEIAFSGLGSAEGKIYPSFSLKWNKDKDKPSYTFSSDDGGMDVLAIIEYTSKAVNLYNGKTYLLGGKDNMLRYLVSLTFVKKK